jgi:uncharacterized membrane protein
MDKLVAVVFRDEKGAYEGVHALAEMNTEGSLDVAQVCVIKKEPDGTISTKEVSDDFPIRTLAGTAIGTRRHGGRRGRWRRGRRGDRHAGRNNR